jgi:hypothetical protein
MHQAVSRFKGVSRTGNAFQAVINLAGDRAYWGSSNFPPRERWLAALAYDEAARELYGAFAVTNFPEGSERSAIRF